MGIANNSEMRRRRCEALSKLPQRRQAIFRLEGSLTLLVQLIVVGSAERDRPTIARLHACPGPSVISDMVCMHPSAAGRPADATPHGAHPGKMSGILGLAAGLCRGLGPGPLDRRAASDAPRVDAVREPRVGLGCATKTACLGTGKASFHRGFAREHATTRARRQHKQGSRSKGAVSAFGLDAQCPIRESFRTQQIARSERYFVLKGFWQARLLVP